MPDWPEPRRRLVARLAGTRERALTLVVAPAGYGKTVALRAIAPDAMVVLESCHRDVARLANDVGRALGLGPIAPVQALGPDDRLTYAESLAADICATLAGRGSDVLVVLDAIDQLDESDEAAVRFVQTLAAQAPPSVHLVLSGRRLPAARLFPSEDADRVDADEFACHDEDVRVLLGDVPPEPGTAVRALTGDWPAALALLGGDVDLAARVLAAEPASWAEAARLFVAALPAASADVLAAVDAIGVADAEVLAALELTGDVDWLVRVGLLVADRPDGAARVSPALAGVLDADPVEAARWRSEAAQHLDRAGRYEDALRCFGDTTEGRDYARVRAEELLDGDAALAVVTALRPRIARADRTERLLLARAAAALGDHSLARNCYDAARADDPRLPAAFAWRCSALAYYEADVDTALAVARDALPTDEPADEAMVAAALASALWASGAAAEAEPHVRRAEQAAVAVSRPVAMAAAQCAAGLVAGALGDPRANARFQHAALAAAIESGDRSMQARIHNNLAATAFFDGDRALALEEMDRALAAARGFSVTTGYALGNKAAVFLEFGRLDDARTAAVDAVENLAMRRPVAANATHRVLGLIDRERGDLVRANASFAAAARMSDECGDIHTAAMSRADLARGIAADDPAEARVLIAGSLEQASELERAHVLACGAWVELAADQRHSAAELATAGQSAAGAAGDAATAVTCAEILAVARPVPSAAELEDAVAQWEQLGNPIAASRTRLALARMRGDAAAEEAATAELDDRGLTVDFGIAALLPAVGADLTEIRISTLGRFELSRSGSAVPVTEWQSRKARDLLKLLIAVLGKPLSRDAVAAALWPDDDSAGIGNRLSVLLSTVRRICDPDRQHAPDHFIRADGNALSLRTERVSVDVFDLLDAAREADRLLAAHSAERAEPLLRRIDRLYQGEFLAEDPYADWVLETRDRVFQAAQSALRLLARSAARRNDDDAAVRNLWRLLERDAFDEPAWLALIGALLRLRRYGEARRAHARYARAMAELDVAPHPLAGLVDRTP